MAAVLWVNASAGHIAALGGAPERREELARYFAGPWHQKFEFGPTGRKAKGRDRSGQSATGELIYVQGVESMHEKELVTIDGRRFSGGGLLAVRYLNAGELGPNLTSPTGLIGIQNVDKVARLVSFKQDEAENAASNAAPKRYDLEQLETYLKVICQTAESAGRDGTIRFQAFDRYGQVAAAKNFRPWHFAELRRWCLDCFDGYLSVRYDWLLRAPNETGNHAESLPIGTLASGASKGAGDFVIHGPDGDAAFDLQIPAAPAPKKNSKVKWYPVPGLSAFSEESEQLVTWTWGREQ